MPTTAPYGSWSSPITPDNLVERVVGLDDPLAIGGEVFWSESRPSEGGRQVIVRRAPNGDTADVLPAGFSARTLVHEYGGRCFTVQGSTVFFSNFEDQRLYRVDRGGSAVPITPPDGSRFADPVVDSRTQEIVCVRERHLDTGVVNDLVAVAADGGTAPRVVAAGRDFYAAPRISPDGQRMAWITWDLPRMPWDGTELWEQTTGGGDRLIAGGTDESITQPRYAPDGRLHWISDRSGWWNLYVDGAPVVARAAEFAGPDWVFGNSSYAFVEDQLVVSWSEAGGLRLGVVRDGEIDDVPTPFTDLKGLQPADGAVIAVAASPTDAPAVVTIAIPDGRVSLVRSSRDVAVAAGYLSAPEAIEFPTEQGRTAHALFYPPTNPDFDAPPGERPPLIVISHGGPTSAARPTLNYGIQFWTSRGIAVVDVDYGGSSGYGRSYRQRLDGQWGVVDVDDCVNVTRWLAAHDRADGNRLVIRGGSAGGYTTLAALTFRDVFAAGGSHYGVADAGALARDTHKFESRYLDRLIGPWPEAEALYRDRSPIFHTDRLRTPLILFQGSEDRVVPPNQAEMMAAALDAKGVPHALIVYDGEQHGFRKAENIKRTAALELAFYGRVLGFEPTGPAEPLEIAHADALRPPA